MSETSAKYGSVAAPPIIERFITFTINEGEWDIQSWPAGHRPLTGKVYKLRIVVPAELVGQTIEANVEPAI
jgi:hypothetical protein